MVSVARSSVDYYDIIIIGAGPAGLSTATELVEKGALGSRILVLDMGPDISNRVQSREAGLDEFNTYGLGGAGLFSDGKLCMPDQKSSRFPMDQELLRMREALPNPYLGEVEARTLYEDAHNLFRNLSVAIRENRAAEDSVNRMRELFGAVGIYFDYYHISQIEASDLPKAIDNLGCHLESHGVTVQLSTKVLELRIDARGSEEIKLLKCSHNGQDRVFGCRFLVLAVGKIGTRWLTKQTDRLGIAMAFRPIEIGVRVEVPNSVLDPFTRVHRDLKLLRKINATTLAKTFCTCSGGIVLPCRYDDLLVLGGYTKEAISPNTNFALLIKMDLKPVNPIEYGFSVTRTANIVGEGKPLVQRLGDMRRGIASSESDIQSNRIKTTLSTYTPTNIGLAYPKFIVDALLETLLMFDEVIPGINNDLNIVSGPCLESCYQKFMVNHNMETNKKGIYVIGDVAGYANGIIPAATSGILAAREIAERMGTHYWSLHR
jgi:uncharacterized FAD-dependent dehydrogenase